MAVPIAAAATFFAALSFSAWRTHSTLTHPRHQQLVSCPVASSTIEQGRFSYRLSTTQERLQHAEALTRATQSQSPTQLNGWILSPLATSIMAHPRCGALIITRQHAILWTPLTWQIALVVFVMMMFAAMTSLYALFTRPLLFNMDGLQKKALRLGQSDFPHELVSHDEPFFTFERALHQTHDRLEHDAALLTQRAELLEQHMNELSHDLKTPLGTLRLLLEGVTTSEHSTQALNRAMLELEYMEQLLQNLSMGSLLASQLLDEASKERFELNEQLESLMLRAKVLARYYQQDEVRLIVDTPHTIILHTHLILVRRALTNLLDNALRHGRSPVLLTLSTPQNATDQGFVIELRDHGPGFEPQDAEITSGRTRYGLKITKSCLAKLGWQMTIHTTTQGTTVTLSCPALESVKFS